MEKGVIKERRRYERYPIYCPLEYKSEDERPKEPAVTLNLSEGGALISARQDLGVSSNVILKLKLRDELFFIIGKVKHVRPGDSNNVYEVGVEFWDRAKTFAPKFSQELEGIIEYQRRYKEENGTDISLAEASIDWYKNLSDSPQ